MKLNKFKKKFDLKTKKAPEGSTDPQPVENDDAVVPEIAKDANSLKSKGKNKRKFNKAFSNEKNEAEVTQNGVKNNPKNEVDDGKTQTSADDTEIIPKKKNKKQKANKTNLEISQQNDSAKVDNQSTQKKGKNKNKAESSAENGTEATPMDTETDSVPKKKNKKKKLNQANKENDKTTNGVETPKPLSLPNEIKDSRDSRTIFVGNLPVNFKKKQLSQLFSKCGEIEKLWTRGVIPESEKISKKVANAKKLFHKDQLSLLAYILYKSAEDAKKALVLNGELFEGRHLRVSLSTDKNYDKNKGVFIGNLPFNITDDDVWNFFKDCGEIFSVRVIRDTRSGLGKGFGYVNFTSADAVELALKLNDAELQSREIRVKRLISDGKQKKLKKRKLLHLDGTKLGKSDKKGKPKKPDAGDEKSKLKFKKKKSNKVDLKKKELAAKLLAKPKKKEASGSSP